MFSRLSGVCGLFRIRRSNTKKIAPRRYLRAYSAIFVKFLPRVFSQQRGGILQAPVLANCEEKKPHVNLPSSYLSANFSTANPSRAAWAHYLFGEPLFHKKPVHEYGAFYRGVRVDAHGYEFQPFHRRAELCRDAAAVIVPERYPAAYAARGGEPFKSLRSGTLFVQSYAAHGVSAPPGGFPRRRDVSGVL